MSNLDELIKSQKATISKQERILKKLEDMAAKRNAFVRKCEALDTEALAILDVSDVIKDNKIPNAKKKKKKFHNNTSLGNMILETLASSKKPMNVKQISAKVKNDGYKSASEHFPSVVYQSCLGLSENKIIFKIKDKNTKRVFFEYHG